MSPPTCNLLLIGLRGSGKSTLGKRLAERLGRPFVDLDEMTLMVLRCPTVEDAWQRYGQDEFREGETTALMLALNQGDDQIIALGGGTPTAPGATDLLRHLRRLGQVRLIYLRATPATLRDRLEHAGAGDRPSITGRGTLEEISAVHEARDPDYEALANTVILVEGKSEDDVLGDLVGASLA